MTSTQQAPAAGRDADERMATSSFLWLLLATCGAATMVFVIIGMVLATNPTIARSLHATQSDTEWISVAYPLMLASLLLPAGGVADRLGRKKALVLGMGVMSAAMFAASAAGSPAVLTVALLAGGLGAGTAFSCTLATITVAVPPQQRRTAISVWAAAVPLGGLFGTLLSGVMIAITSSWSSPFIVVGVLAAATCLLSLAVVPETRELRTQPLDPLGIVLSVIGVASLVLALTKGPVDGWGDPVTLALLASAALALSGFVWWEAHAAMPMLEVGLFRLPGFGAAAAAIFATFFALYAAMLILFQFEAYAFGYSPLRGGLGIVPIAATMLPGALLGPALAQQRGPKFVVTTALTCGVIGQALWAGIGADGGWLILVPGMLFFGAAIGLCAGPVTEIITEQLPPAKQGVASAVNNLTRELGATLGIAIGGTTFNIGYRHEIGTHLSHSSTLAAIAKSSPVAGLQTAHTLTGSAADHFLGAIHSGVNLGWIIAMSTIGAGFILALMFFLYRFPSRRISQATTCPPPPAPLRTICTSHQINRISPDPSRQRGRFRYQRPGRAPERE